MTSAKDKIAHELMEKTCKLLQCVPIVGADAVVIKRVEVKEYLTMLCTSAEVDFGQGKSITLTLWEDSKGKPL